MGKGTISDTRIAKTYVEGTIRDRNLPLEAVIGKIPTGTFTIIDVSLL